VDSFRALAGHPKLGASWEGFVVEEVIRRVSERNAWFWATQSGAELDLLFTLRGKRYGVEVKYADAPALTKSMRIAREDLKLRRLLVVYPGPEPYDLDEHTRVIPFEDLGGELSRLERQS